MDHQQERDCSEKLIAITREKYDLFESQSKEAIVINELADAVYDEIDPSARASLLVHYSSLLQLRQYAAVVCRKRVGPERVNTSMVEQGTLFAGLQPRYPVKRDGDEVYVLREKLTYEERMENSRRMRAEGQSKIAHADALDAETQKLIAQGQLKKPDAA